MAARTKLDEKEAVLKGRLEELRLHDAAKSPPLSPPLTQGAAAAGPEFLSLEDVERFSRQLCVRGWGGARTQTALAHARVVIVGCGGLGVPAALALAAAGVGSLTLVDDGETAISDAPRQWPLLLSPAMARGERGKAALLAAACATVAPPWARTLAMRARAGPANALALISGSNVVIDATDTAAARFLLSDACQLAGAVPLVSGAALGAYGQVGVFGGGGGAPCYRCLHPSAPPAPESCADAGALGPVTGATGALLALEAMKVLALGASADNNTAPRLAGVESLAGRLLYLDGAAGSARVARLRGRRADCLTCGDAPAIKSMADSAAWIQTHGLAWAEGGNRVSSCAAAAAAGVAEVAPADAALALASAPPAVRPLLVDVRSPEEFSICALPGSLSVPLASIELGPAAALAAAGLAALPPSTATIYTVCRRGIDSAAAARILSKDLGFQNVASLRGGLAAWSSEVDAKLPVY